LYKLISRNVRNPVKPKRILFAPVLKFFLRDKTKSFAVLLGNTTQQIDRKKTRSGCWKQFEHVDWYLVVPKIKYGRTHTTITTVSQLKKEEKKGVQVNPTGRLLNIVIYCMGSKIVGKSLVPTGSQNWTIKTQI
jgi:hypothetical protein